MQKGQRLSAALFLRLHLFQRVPVRIPFHAVLVQDVLLRIPAKACEGQHENRCQDSGNDGGFLYHGICSSDPIREPSAPL